MALSPSEARALGAAEEFLTELADLHAETQIAEAGEYADPGDFADAVLNNLPAISYALNAGLPVTAWSPVQKNGAETERVLRAVRQWSEQARNLIEAYAAASITQDQLWEGLAAAYAQQSTNAFVAGRRAVGNLAPMGAAQQALLASQQAADLQRLQTDAATGATGGGALSMLVKSIFDPTNYFGSGLPGDPFAPHHSTEKLATTMAHRVEQYGQSIASTSHLGEMSGLSEIPDEVVIVWWELGDADHCVDCIQLADMSPYLEDTLMADGIFPGSGHTQCGSNCGCSLNYDIPSEVCGDSLTDASEIGEAARNTRNIMRNTNDGTRYAVWVQEAASCDLPIGIEAFAGDVTPLDILDDDEAFSWDDDLALAMEGDLAASVGLAEADQKTWGWLADYLKADAAAERIGRLVMKADNVTYEFAWRETADAVVFDFGRTTKGLTTLDPDMTLKALSQLSDRAAELKVPLRINADTAGPGMQKWLDAVATDRVVGTPLPPTVIPRWDFIPGAGPVTGAVTPSVAELKRLPEVDALPTITDAEAAKLTASTPLPVVTLSTGTTEKELFLDGNGQEWLAKSNAAKAEATATGIATDMGLRVVPVTRMGQTTALQPILKGARGIDSDIASQAEAFHQLTNAQAVEVINQSPLDFVLGNNDAHSGQWIIDSEGKLWGVDKDASFMGMGFSPNDTYFWPSDEEYGTLIGAAFTNPLKSGLLAKVKPEDVVAALDRIDTYGADRLVEAMRNGGVLDSIPGAFGDEAGEALARARMGNVRNAFEQKFRQVIEGYDEAYRPPEWQAWLDAGGKFVPGPKAAAPVVDILPAATEPVVAQISRDKAIDIATVLSGNYSGWAKDLTASERSAFQLYQADSGASLADHLRKGTSTKIADVLAQATGQPTMAERIAAMDSAISRGVLPQDVAGYGGADLKRVFRGATDRHGVPKVGALISDPGYMSTSIDPKVAVKFAADRAEVQGGTPLVYRIAMPEGQPGVYLDEFFGGDLGYEREILLPRNSSFRVEAVTTGADLGDGLKGIVVDLTPQAPPALAVLPKAPAKAALPASMRATATDISYVGTNRAAWQATFRPAKTLGEAVERLGDLIPGKNHLDEFSLSQMNVILARAETLDSMGFDLTRITRLDDFAKVPEQAKHGRVGLTKGHTIAIRHDAKWQFFPEAAIDQHPTIYDDVGGAFAHEYGHVLIEDLSPEGKKALAAIRDAHPGVAFSDYAAQDLDEWLGEVVSAVTQPGYLPGTLPFDEDVYALLGRERLLTQPKGELIAVGPPKALIDPAAGIKPGDTQMYLVGDNPLPVNAPLAEWSGIIPAEPALPAGLKASKDEIAAAKAEADAAWMSWRDVAAGKTDVALTWSGAEREAGEQAGLIYREVKAPGAKSSTRFVARDKEAADRAEAWLKEPGHDATSDAFWIDVLGYTPEQIAKIDAADALAKGGKRLSAGVVMVEPDGRVWVLSPKNEFAGYQNTWVKGGVDEGETAAQAAVREMREESGFSVELDSYLGDYVNTDKTGLTRMYVGHRTGGGPMGAHLKETYKMRLLDQDEAAKLLTRYGKPDARDQTILADAMTAINGEAPLTHYEIGADEVDHFRDLVTPKSYASAIDAPKGKTGGSIWDDMDRLGFGINPRPNLGPAASAQFGYDAKYVKQLAPTYVEYPASSTKFPYATSKWKLATGEEQPMYWKVEAGGSATSPAAAALTVPTPTPSIYGAPATLGVLSATEKAAVVDYSGGDYFWGVSQYLRGNAKGDKDTLRVIKGLDSAFEKAPEVKQTLYRGLGYENPFPVAPEALKPGVTFTDPGFGSTSKELGPAQTYGTLVMKIEPEGVRGIDVEAATGINDEVNKEVVLDRGVTYTVTKVEHKTLDVPYFGADGKYVSTGDTDDFTIVTVTATKKAEATIAVASPVPIPPVPAGPADVVKNVASQLGGMATKRELTDSQGVEWLWRKPQWGGKGTSVAPAVASTANIEGEVITGQLAQAFGLNAVPVAPFTLGSEAGTVQKLLPDASPHVLGLYAPSVTDEQAAEFMRHQVFDYMTGQMDFTQAVTQGGKLFGIDKNGAWFGLARDAAAGSPPASWGKVGFNPLFGPADIALADGGKLAISKFSPADVAAFLDRIDAMPTQAYMDAIDPALTALAKLPTIPGSDKPMLTLDQLRTLAKARKENLRATIGDVFSKQISAKYTPGQMGPEWNAWLAAGGKFGKAEPKLATGTNRLFWANSKKQVADPHLRYNLHVAQLKTLLGKMADDPSIGALRVNDALLNQVPQLRELLVAAGGKTGLSEKWVELSASDGAKLKLTLEQDLPLPVPEPHVPAAPMVPAPKPVIASTTAASYLDAAVPYGVNPSPFADHFITWPDSSGGFDTSWRYDDSTGVITLDGKAATLPVEDVGPFLTAQLLLAGEVANSPGVAAATYVHMTSDMWPSTKHRLAAFQALSDMGMTPEVLVTGKWRWDINALDSWAAKVKGEMGDAGLDPSLLKVDWTPMQPMGATQVAAASLPEATVAGYSAPAVAAAAQASVGDGTAIGKLVESVSEIKITVDGKPFVSSLYGTSADVYEWRRLGNMLEVHKVVGGAFSVDGEAGAAAHLVRMAKAMDEAPKIDGLRFTTAAYDQLSAVSPKVAQMLVDSGGKVYAGGVRLTREQVQAIRDQVLASASTAEAKVAAVAQAVPSTYPWSVAQPPIPGKFTYTKAKAPVESIWPGEAAAYNALTTLDERKAFLLYKQHGYGAVNGFLRDGTFVAGQNASIATKAELDNVIAKLDTIVEHKPLAQDTVVWRSSLTTDGLGLPGKAGLSDLQALVGKPITEAGYMSTTLDPAMWPYPYLLQMRAPKGTAAFYRGGGEHELLLGRGRSYTITGVTERQIVHDGKTTTQYVLTADILPAAAKATEPKIIPLDDLLTGTAGVKGPAPFVPTMGPKFDFDPKEVGTFSPTLIPQKQGFSKVEFTAAGATAPAGSVRVRTLSKEIVFAGLSAEPGFAADVLTARLRMLKSEIEAAPGIEQIRFDPAGISTLKGNLPAGIHAMLFKYGAIEVNDTIYLAREKAWKLAQDLDYEVKGTLGQLAPGKAAVADVVAAAPAPASAVNPDFWDKVEMSPDMLNPSFGWAATPSLGGEVDFSMPSATFTATVMSPYAFAPNQFGPLKALHLGVIGATPTEALLMLDDLTQRVVEGKIGAVVIAPSMIKTLGGQKVTDQLQALGAVWHTNNSTSLLIDKSTADNLWHAMHGNVPLSAAVAAPVTPSSLQGAMKLSDQFHFNPADIGSTTAETKQTLKIGQGSGEVSEGLHGVKFEWDADVLKLEFDAAEPLATSLMVIADTADQVIPSGTTLIVKAPTSQSIIGNPLAEVLQAAGAVEGGKTYWFLTDVQAKALAQSVWNDTPLPRLKLGSAVVDTNAIEPSIVELLKPAHPGFDDPADWAGVLSNPPLTGSPVTSDSGIAQAVHWETPSGSAVTATMKIPSDGQMLVWEALGASTSLPVDEWAQVAIAQFHDIAAKLDSKLGAYTNVSLIKLDQLLVGSVPEVKTIAQAFGGVEISGSIVLKSDQLKAIGKAIDSQIVSIPNSPAALAGVTQAKLAGGWSAAGAAEWTVGSGMSNVSLLSNSVAGPAGGWVTKITKPYGGQLAMDWHAVTSMHALQWDKMTSVGAPIVGDDLTNAAGAFFHKLVAEAADSNGQVFVAYDVLEAMDPAIGKLMIDAGGAHIGAALPQWNNVKGITLTSADTKALLAKLDAEVPNPLGAVNPVAKVGEPVLDYDPAHISSVLSGQPVNVLDMGGSSKAVGLNWNGTADISIVYKQAVGTLKQVTGINLPYIAAGPGEDNALAALLGQFLVHVKADGGLPLFEKPILDAYPGLRGTLKEIGFKGGEGGATSMTLLPEDLQGAIDKLMGGGVAAAQPSTFIDPYIASVGGADMVKAVKSAISATVLDALPKVADQPMAQGFGKLVSGTLETKYRASAKTITIKTTSGFAAFNDQLVTLLKVAEKVDAAPGVTSVVFETAWGDKSALAKKLLTDHGATDVGTGVVASREEMLKIRDAIMADLKGLPAPVGSAAPVAGGATVAAAVKAPTYNVGALAGLGSGDVPTVYATNLPAGLTLPPSSNFAVEHGGTFAAVSLDDFYYEDATVNDIFHLTLLKAGPNAKQDILAMLSAYGSDAEAGSPLPFFLPQKLLDSAPGLSRILKPYGIDVSGALGHAGLDEDGLLFTAEKANDLILHLYQGIPLADALPVAAAIPAAIVTEPLATKLGWDLTKLTDFEAAPTSIGYLGGKERSLMWKDVTAAPPTAATGWKVPPGSDITIVRTKYQDYVKHLVYEGDLIAWSGAGTDPQRAAAAWKSIQHLANEAKITGRPLMVTSDAIAEHPEIGKLLDLYGAGPEKTFMKYTGRDLTPAQAKQLADDLAANAPITGAPSPAAIPIAPAAAPVVPKSAAQIEADYIDELVKGNAVGGSVGGSLKYAIIADGLDSGVQTYVVNGVTKATLQWSAADVAMHVEDIGIAGIGTVEAKVALADAAKLADQLGYPLLVDDAAIGKALSDDMGGLIYWSSANDAWTTSEPAKLADYLLGKQKAPVGQALKKPIAAAPPPVPTVAAAVPPPAAAASGMGDVYGFDHGAAKALADTLQPGSAIAPPKFTILNDTPLTKLYQTEWSNGATLKWAEEQQGDARILRVRAATGGTATQKADAITASLMAEWPAYLGTHPEVDRVLINKGALADTPALASMLADAGWKETKEYWVLGRDAVGEMSKALDANGADWAAKSAIPTHVPAGGWSGALPTNPSPSFIYDYNPVTHQQLVASIVDKDIGALDLGGGAGAGHELTVGKIKVTYSISPSGNTIGIGKIEVDPTAASHEKVDAMMAALQHVGDQMAGRSGQLWVKPDLYQQIPGLAQVMKDAGAAEQSTAKIGDIIQMTSAQASVLTKALKTDDMAGLTISISSSSEYLSYNPSLAAAMFAKEPADLGKGVLRYDTGATGTAKTTEARIALSADGKTGELIDVKADASVTTITVASQINWFVTHGATDVLISTDTLAKVPKLDKYLVSLGGKIEGGGIRLTDQTLFKTRAALTKNLLPVPLGGDPAKFAFSITDTMIAAPDEIMQAVHSELVGTVGAKSVSEYIVNSRKIRVSFTRSEGNIYWEGIERGDATIGMARSASVAQMRTFLNDMAQNAGLHRLDVSLDVLADQPGLRDVLRKYGAKEVAATADHPAYLSLERTHAMKLRKDVEAELGQLQGGTAAVINGQTTITVWPVADELTIATKSLGGQTAKNVFRDAQGNEWMFKPGASGQGAAADKAAAEIAALMGLPVPPVRIYTLEVNGKLVEGSLQKLIPGAKGIEQIPLASLTPVQQQALWQHSALDWVIANDDAHVGNWLIGPDGTFWGIDKTRAFKTFGDPRRDVLDVNSLGQGGTDAMAPSFFKWWKDARRNPALLQAVHPTTITKPLRALRAVDDATYRSIVTPLAKIAAGGNPKYKGDWAKMVEDMVARKNSAANDLQQFMATQLTEIKRAGTALPPEWDAWLRGGGKLNLDATPEDLLKERMAVIDAQFGGTKAADLKRQLQSGSYSKINNMVSSGYGSGVTGATSGAGQVKVGAGHAGGGGGYGYEKIRPTLRATPAGAKIADEWEALNEGLILHALFDSDTSWAVDEWVKTLRKFYDPDKGTVTIIRSTNGYSGGAKASLEGYTRDGFRNLFSAALGAHVEISGHGVYIYADVEPKQIFSSMFGGFSAHESEVAIADLRIDQVRHIASTSKTLGPKSSYQHSADAAIIMGYHGPVVSGP